MSRRIIHAAAALLLVTAGTASAAGATGVAAAQAPAAGPVLVSVDPSSGLQDGQVVQIDVSGFPASTVFGSAICDDVEPLTLDHCASITLSGTSDATGSATFSRGLSRYIVTTSGIHDCAVDACRVAIASPSLTDLGTAPVAFAPGPPPSSGLQIALGDPVYLTSDPTGPATVPATLSCDASATISVTFTVAQASAAGGAPDRASSHVSVPCQPGTSLAITSDLTGTFSPGPAEVLVVASGGPMTGIAFGDVEVQSFATTMAALQARLDDPDDTTVVDELNAALLFRLERNPRFARVFWRAVLTGSPS